MSTIERAGSMLGRGGRSGREKRISPVTPRAEDGASRPSGDQPGRKLYRELDIARLTAHRFATPANSKTRLASDFRRLKRPLLSNMMAQRDRPSGINPPNLIVVTSALPGEGKTFVAINLALSVAAEVDSSALLIDGDPLKGDVAKSLDFDYETGLLDIVRDWRDPESVVIGTNIDGLSLLPCGRIESTGADELFASERMARTLHELALRDRHRAVLVDAPPLLAGTIASVLGSICGQVLVVVEAERTPQAAVTEAVAMLEGCQSVQMTLNKANRRASQHLYYDYGYGYGYGKDS